jgi:hypothetical protein
MPADSVETAAGGKATSGHRDRRNEKDVPRPKQKHPADPAIVAAAAGKFTPGPRTSNVTEPSHERPMPRGPPPPRAAFTIREFCEAHRISQAMYFEMKKEGYGPAEMGVGRRRLISYEAASAWRREREVEAAALGERAKRSAP